MLDRRPARLVQRVRERLDHLRHGLLGDATVVQLHLDHRHVRPPLVDVTILRRDGAGRHLVDGPGLAAEPPVLRVVPLDDHPRVVPQARMRRLAERVRELLDERGARLVAHAVVEELDPDQRHSASFRSSARLR